MDSTLNGGNKDDILFEHLARFLTEDAPQLKEDDHDIQVISAIKDWNH